MRTNTMKEIKNLVNQTLEQIYSRESYRSYQQQSDPIRNKVAMVIVRLGLIYGHLFTSNYKTEEMLEAMITQWVREVGSYSYENLEKGITRCLKEHKETVNLPQFMDCLKLSQYQAMLERSCEPLCLTHLETDENKLKRMERGKIAINKIRESIENS